MKKKLMASIAAIALTPLAGTPLFAADRPVGPETGQSLIGGGAGGINPHEPDEAGLVAGTGGWGLPSIFDGGQGETNWMSYCMRRENRARCGGDDDRYGRGGRSGGN